MNEFNIIIEQIKLFDNMYDFIRIVDPVKKEVLELKFGESCNLNSECYKFWEINDFSENYISMKAYNEDDTFFKIEFNKNRIYIIIAVPILINKNKFVLEILKDTTNNLLVGKSDHEYDIKFLSTIEHMNQAAVRDELTKLYNRRFINERLPADMLKATINNEPLSIIFADLDFFKTINDTYGHTIGDQVLGQFAEILKNSIRKEGDWAARYGGEEFLVCLSNTDIKTARLVAERIRKTVMNKEFIVDNQSIRITCSLGVHTVYDSNECVTVKDIIEKADKYLYQAKVEGRNRVVG